MIYVGFYYNYRILDFYIYFRVKFFFLTEKYI